MSVTLLFSYPPYASGATVTLDRATEAALVQQGRATYTSNPGPVFSPLTAVEQQSLRDFLPSGQALVSGGGILPERLVGYELEQPANITKPVTRYGKLACRFGSGMWASTAGSPTLTQGYTGWNGSGAKTGITSRTGQPDMLKAVPAANSTETIRLQTFATNMLTPSLGGKFGLWVYVEAQPGYQVGGTVAGSITVSLSLDDATMGNSLDVGFNTNQIREGWNFLTFVMRTPAAYVPSSGVTEYHPFGISCSGYGTGAATDILNSPVARLQISWANMQGASLYFDSMWTNFSAKPQMVLGCDGGTNLMEIAYPLFQTYGWIGYLALPYRVYSSGSKVITDLTTARADVLQAYSAGWDFVNHTANHLSNGTLSSEAELAYEMETARAWQYAQDYPRGAEFYASPQSSTSRLSELVIKAIGFKFQRHIRRWNTPVTPFGIDNPHHVGALDMGSASQTGVSAITGGAGSTVAGWQVYSKLTRVLDIAEAYGETVFPFWHGITTSGDSGSGEDLTGDNLLLTRSAFTKFCEDLRAREVAGRITVCKGMSGFWYGGN